MLDLIFLVAQIFAAEGGADTTHTAVDIGNHGEIGAGVGKQKSLAAAGLLALAVGKLRYLKHGVNKAIDSFQFAYIAELLNKVF